MFLRSFLYRFFIHFGSQIPSKTLPKTDQKKHQILNRFFIDFWWILASILGPIWLPNRLFRLTRGVKKRQKRRFKASSQKSSQNDPKMTPKWPQKPPPGHQFSTILGSFFKEFGENPVLLFRACAWYSLGSCSVFALYLLDNCLVPAWWLLGTCLVFAW